MPAAGRHDERRMSLYRPSQKEQVRNTPEATGNRSDGIALAVGSLTNGIAAYLYVLAGTQILGAEAFAPISVLWTIWSFAAATLTFPIQHWIIRTMQAESGERPIRAARPTLVAIAGVAATLTFLTTYLARNRLFGAAGLGYPSLAAVIVLSSAILGFSRGILAGRGRFKAAATVVAGENLLRFFAGALILMLSGGPLAYATALTVGMSILVLYPDSLSARDTGPSTRASVGRMLAGIAGGTLIAQVILTGPPILLAALGGRPETITALFATAAVARAPYLVALGLAIRANARLSWMAVNAPGRLRRASNAAIAVSIGASLAAAAAAAWLGPEVIESVFGPGTSLAPGPTALVAGGSVLALGSLGLTVVLIARGDTTPITVAWVIAVVVAIAAAVFFDSAPLTRTITTFAIAETTAFIALTAGASFRNNAPAGTS